MDRLSWYLKRLSVMQRGEIPHRIVEQIHLRLLRSRQRLDGHSGAPPAGDWRGHAFCTAGEARLPALPWRFEPTADDGAAWRRGAWPALGFAWRWQDEPDVWRRAPDTGKLWPMEFFGDIAYRAGNPFGDVRLAWEPARMQQLVTLALLAGRENGAEAVALLEAQLASWVKQNPPYLGIHYISAMECALRMIAACHALELVRGRLTRAEESWSGLLAIVYSHAPLIERRLSLYSSSGNHTIAECAGLVYAGTLFAEHPRAAQWRRRGLDILAREAARQVLADGGGIERAFEYHRFVIDLLGLVDRLLAHTGAETPKEIAQALDRGRRFLAAVSLPNGDVMPVGDGDGGYALSRFLRLNGPDAVTEETVVHFPESGYSVLRADGGRSTLALFDHGPHGMAPSYGHAHADALSLLLYRHGEPILIDPGTFTYTGPADWRRYFRSTAAHNTVTVNGRDQAAQETAFQWSAPLPCRLINADVAQGVVRMLGYVGGGEPGQYRHMRGVAYCPDEWIFVWDLIDGGEMIEVEQHWHCGVTPRPTHMSRFLELKGKEGSVLLRARGGGGLPQVVTGAEGPALGWRSPIYGRKTPCAVIRRVSRTRPPASFDTIITLSGPGPDNAVMGETIVRWQKWARDAGAY